MHLLFCRNEEEERFLRIKDRESLLLSLTTASGIGRLAHPRKAHHRRRRRGLTYYAIYITQHFCSKKARRKADQANWPSLRLRRNYVLTSNQIDANVFPRFFDLLLAALACKYYSGPYP